jgi:predicted amidohydrolase
VKIGIARLYTKNADPAYNFCSIEKMYTEAVDRNLEFIIFPRLSLSGFSVDGNFLDESYTRDLLLYFEKIIKLTDGKKVKMLVGNIFYEEGGEKDSDISKLTRRDSAFFIGDGYVNVEISRKEIDRNNVMDDYRYFDGQKFLEYFSCENKKFSVLLSDDIYSNFNIFLLKDNRPDYIVCLDSSLKSLEFIEKRLIKLAKLVDCPVFYLNSASYLDGLLFKGEIILINEDFVIKFNDTYSRDEIISFEVDCEDGTELLLENSESNGEKYSEFSIMEKYFGYEKIVIDIDKVLNFSPDKVRDFNYEFVTFRRPDLAGIKFIDLEKYIDPKLFKKLPAKWRSVIKSRIIDLYHSGDQ